jgi:general stress protein 26
MTGEGMRGNDVTTVGELLAGAARSIQKLRYCWLLTSSEHGVANVRPMGRLAPNTGTGTDQWTLRFLADRRSRKAADIRRSKPVVVTFQDDPAEAFVTLFGDATLVEGESDVRERWRDAYDAIVPMEARRHAMFIEVEAHRMELWIRGVTPEPFGRFPTVLEHDANQGWQMVG